LGRCKYTLILTCKIANVCKVSGATGFVQNYAGLVALRFLCGVTEAPYFVGAIFFLSSWYTKIELPFRIAIFYLGYTLASAFGGLIAAGILDGMDGLGGYQSWVCSNRPNEIFA
jgi:MFS family permease